MTRPPLELLELLIRANAAAQEPGEANADLAAEFVAMMADPATGEQLRALRAQAEAALRVEQAARELMERSEQPEHTCNWSYGRGARDALKDIHGVLAQTAAGGEG